MSSTAKKISPVLTELEIVVPATRIDESADKMFKRLSRQAKVKGFRQGKIPLQVAKRMFSKSVYAELTGDLTYQAFLESLKEHEISPIGEPEFLDLDKVVARGEDFKFKAKVETAPVLEKIITDGIELTKPKVVADPEVVEKELARLRSTMATTKDLSKPRKVKKGDLVKLEMSKKEQDGSFSDPMPEQEIVLEEDICPEELLKALPGMNVGDETEIELGPKSGDRVNFKCVVKEHKQRVLPKLDDDFAKDLGAFDTLEELKADIEKRYVDSMERQHKEKLKRDLFDALREKNQMELPPSILEKQTEAMRRQYDSIIAQVKTDEEKGDADADSKMEESAKLAAKEMVHTHFLIDEIARHGELKISDEDLEAHFKEMSEATGMPLARIKAEYSDKRYATELESRLLEDKVFDFIAPKVKITESEPVEDGSEGK